MAVQPFLVCHIKSVDFRKISKFTRTLPRSMSIFYFKKLQFSKNKLYLHFILGGWVQEMNRSASRQIKAPPHKWRSTTIMLLTTMVCRPMRIAMISVCNFIIWATRYFKQSPSLTSYACNSAQCWMPHIPEPCSLEPWQPCG